MRWGSRVAVAVSQLANAILFGWPDEAMSSRAYRQQHKRRWRIARALVDAMFWPIEGPGHCARAYQRERERRHVAPEFRA